MVYNLLSVGANLLNLFDTKHDTRRFSRCTHGTYQTILCGSYKKKNENENLHILKWVCE